MLRVSGELSTKRVYIHTSPEIDTCQSHDELLKKDRENERERESDFQQSFITITKTWSHQFLLRYKTNKYDKNYNRGQDIYIYIILGGIQTVNYHQRRHTKPLYNTKSNNKKRRKMRLRMRDTQRNRDRESNRDRERKGQSECVSE